MPRARGATRREATRQHGTARHDAQRDARRGVTVSRPRSEEDDDDEARSAKTKTKGGRFRRAAQGYLADYAPRYTQRFRAERPSRDVDVHVRGTPASFGTTRLLLSCLSRSPYLFLSPSPAIVARGVPAVVAFTRDAMPRSPRRGAAKNDHQVSRLPLCTHIHGLKRASVCAHAHSRRRPSSPLAPPRSP